MASNRANSAISDYNSYFVPLRHKKMFSKNEKKRIFEK